MVGQIIWCSCVVFDGIWWYLRINLIVMLVVVLYLFFCYLVLYHMMSCSASIPNIVRHLDIAWFELIIIAVITDQKKNPILDVSTENNENKSISVKNVLQTYCECNNLTWRVLSLLTSSTISFTLCDCCTCYNRTLKM